jgi:hypothetical protein
MADENFGVIEANKSYTHHAIARVLGVADSSGRCSQFVLNRLLKEGLPFRKVGKFYFINGQVFCLWIQEGSASWEAWTEDTKSSDVEDEADSFAGGTTNHSERGGKKRSTRRGGETPNS